MPDIVTPKILQNVPVGKDEFASQSQEHIAESIKKLILNIDNEESPIRLIGIEGGWGTGKSNLVKILEKKLKGKGYSFFLYDAWGHQEDLHRRAIIEELSDFVEEKEICSTCKEKLADIREETLGTEVLVRTVQSPEFSWAFFWAVLGIVCFPVIEFIGKSDIIKNSFLFQNFPLMGWILKAIPELFLFIALFIIIWGAFKQANRQSQAGEWIKNVKLFFSCLKNKTLQVYRKNEEKNTTTKRINQFNPSSNSFKNFLHVIDDGLQKSKLVIVIDNIDRMNKEKVKDIWATIHMCFSSAAELHNILVLVPFDKNKIGCVKSFV